GGELTDPAGGGGRRSTLHARLGAHGVLKVGFAAANSHDIIPVNRCPILDPALAGALDAAWALAEPILKGGKPLDIQITATKNGLDVDVRGSGALPSSALPARALGGGWGKPSAGGAARARRAGADAPCANRCDGTDAGDVAARLVPASHDRGRGNAGRARCRALRKGKTRRRSVLRGRAI